MDFGQPVGQALGARFGSIWSKAPRRMVIRCGIGFGLTSIELMGWARRRLKVRTNLLASPGCATQGPSILRASVVVALAERSALSRLKRLPPALKR
jgi:hypothetical protein